MIREARADDQPPLQALYRSAFPDEDLLPLLRALNTAQGDVIGCVSVTNTDRVVGHVCFTTCHTQSPPHIPVALLEPLCVAPASQRQGIGGALIEHGCRAMSRAGIRHVCVLGDPGYYQRHRFRQDTGLQPRYPLPAGWGAAWQGRPLVDGPAPEGRLVVPAPWQDPALWA